MRQERAKQLYQQEALQGIPKAKDRLDILIFKYAVTSFLVVLISEVAKRSDKLGGLIAALPLVTVLVLFWLYFEKQSVEKIANHAWYTFWYVIPTLPMFLIFPYVIKHYGFLDCDYYFNRCNHFVFCYFCKHC